MFPNLINHIKQFIELDNKQQAIIEAYFMSLKLKGPS